MKQKETGPFFKSHHPGAHHGMLSLYALADTIPQPDSGSALVHALVWADSSNAARQLAAAQTGCNTFMNTVRVRCRLIDKKEGVLVCLTLPE